MWILEEPLTHLCPLVESHYFRKFFEDFSLKFCIVKRILRHNATLLRTRKSHAWAAFPMRAEAGTLRQQTSLVPLVSLPQIGYTEQAHWQLNLLCGWLYRPCRLGGVHALPALCAFSHALCFCIITQMSPACQQVAYGRFLLCYHTYNCTQEACVWHL